MVPPDNPLPTEEDQIILWYNNAVFPILYRATFLYILTCYYQQNINITTLLENTVLNNNALLVIN